MNKKTYPYEVYKYFLALMNSNIFTDWVLKIRKNYTIKAPLIETNNPLYKVLVTRCPEIDRLIESDLQKNAQFNTDVSELCDFFYINDYQREMVRYILNGRMAPVHSANTLEVTPQGFILRLDLSVSKDDVDAAWKDISRTKKNKSLMNAAGRKNLMPIDYGDYFDTDILLHKQKHKEEIDQIDSRHKNVVLTLHKDQKSRGRKRFKTLLNDFLTYKNRDLTTP